MSVFCDIKMETAILFSGQKTVQQCIDGSLLFLLHVVNAGSVRSFLLEKDAGVGGSCEFHGRGRPGIIFPVDEDKVFGLMGDVLLKVFKH